MALQTKVTKLLNSNYEKNRFKWFWWKEIKKIKLSFLVRSASLELFEAEVLNEAFSKHLSCIFKWHRTWHFRPRKFQFWAHSNFECGTFASVLVLDVVSRVAAGSTLHNVCKLHYVTLVWQSALSTEESPDRSIIYRSLDCVELCSLPSLASPPTSLCVSLQWLYGH